MTILLSSLSLSVNAAMIFNPNNANISGSDTLQSVTDRGSTTTNNITASYFIGNGSQLTGLPSSSPAGSDGQIQFNDGGNFGASSLFRYNTTTEKLLVGSSSAGGGFTVQGASLFGGLLETKFFYDPTTMSFGGGNVESNPVNGQTLLSSFAFGYNIGDSSFKARALGQGSFTINGLAQEQESIAIGLDSESSGTRAVAIATGSLANQEDALAIGYLAEANGQRSSAIGNLAEANGQRSNAIGSVVADADYSVAIGALISGNSLNKPRNTIQGSFLVSFYNGSTNDLLLAQINKGVRIGATSGESITMTGDDLYVKDNTEIDGFLVLGANTEDGLSAGDINASTIYYDTLQAKSPIVMCSDMNCKVTVPELQEDYFITRDEEYNILSFDKPLPTVVTDKFSKLKETKLDNDANIACLSQGRFYEYNNGQCTFNTKASCESDGKSYYTGSVCLENPYLACEQSTDSVWNLDTNVCEYNAEKDCQSKEWNWNPATEVCSKPVIPQETIEQLQRKCLVDVSTMWDTKTNSCIELRLYLAEPYNQPTGAHNAYSIGDVITFNNKYYESTINGNVWSPSTYPTGWSEI